MYSLTPMFQCGTSTEFNWNPFCGYETNAVVGWTGRNEIISAL